MRTLLYVVAGLVALVALVFLTEMVASESGEVVVLHTQTPEGVRETRLWVVELDGIQYLRAGPDSGWYRRLVAAPAVRLTRGATTADYRAETRLAVAEEINRLMREKYGWRDAYIEVLVGGRADAVPVALLPEA
jgi:hypothetical protein